MDESQVSLNESIQVLLTGCFLFFLTSYFAWSKGFYELPQKDQYLSDKKLSLKTLITSFVIFLSLSMFVVPVLAVIAIYLYKGAINLTPKTLIIINNVSILAVFVALGIFQLLISQNERRLIWGNHFGLDRRQILNDISIGILTWFISFPIVLVAGKIINVLFSLFGLSVSVDQVAVSQVKATLSSPSLFLAIALIVVFFVPIIEEFLFRGCLQTWMKGKIGIKKAIVLTSFVFAMFHFSMSQGLGNVELLTSLFVLSCFLGFIYEKQQSLLASISLHAFFNAVTVLMIFFS